MPFFLTALYQTLFGGEKPLDRVRSAEGLIHVLHYLDTARGRP